jgi:hypothetical protein
MLYKYRSFNNYGLQILTNLEIYFSSTEELNDPLECQFKRLPATEEIKKRLTEQELSIFKEISEKLYNEKSTSNPVPIFEAIENKSKQAGIFSLCQTNKDPLMWSHYADGHRGFCIGFSRSYFENLIATSWQELSIVGGGELDYSASPKYLDVIVEYIKNYPKRRNQSFDDFIEQVLISIINTKSNKWCYESEYRMVRFSKGLLKFQPEAIKEIIIGQKTSSSDKTMLFSLLENSLLKHVEKKAAEFSHNSYLMNINYV